MTYSEFISLQAGRCTNVDLAFSFFNIIELQDDTIFNIEQNIANAKKNYVEEDGSPTLFSTQMFHLAEQMLPFVNDGLEQLKSKIERRRIEHK